MAMGRLVSYIIILIVAALFAFYMYSPGGSFDKVRDTVDSAKEFVPNISIGDKGISGGTPTVPENHRQQILLLNQSINKILNGATNDCFLNFGGFPELGVKGTTINLAYDPNDDSTEISIIGGAGGKQAVSSLKFKFEQMVPCVIGDNAAVTKNFDKRFLNSDEEVGNYFSPVSSITISQDDGGYTGFTENRINYGKGWIDFEGQAWLFSPDNRHICFFPTVDGDATGQCDGSQSEGLDDDCLTDITEKESIPYKVTNNKLNSC
jgi:hypothetical protein